MTKINIKHIAKLANLPIAEEKLEKLEKQLEETLEHVDRLQEIDTSKVTGTNEVTKLSNVTRDDVIVPSLTQEEALLNAKQVHNGLFVVPVILEEAVENKQINE
jgi:aspartyl-tRNA(Asn)/glutamyl-tRNA(Gln) amidotransferase subunit C